MTPLQPIPQKKKGSLRWVWFVVGMIVVVGLAVGLLIWRVTGPRGELVGEIDLLGPQPREFAVTASQGDVLHFRWSRLVLDASTETGTTRQRNDSLRKGLTASLVAINVSPIGNATCPAYAGTNAASDLSATTLDLGGVNIDCAIRIEGAGSYRVRPTVAWKPGLKVTTAKLEVRREKR